MRTLLISLLAFSTLAQAAEVTISVDLKHKELRVLEDFQTKSTFIIHTLNLKTNPQCKEGPVLGNFQMINKDEEYTNRFGLKYNHIIRYMSLGPLYIIKEDNGNPKVTGGVCGVLLAKGDGAKLFKVLDAYETSQVGVRIFE